MVLKHQFVDRILAISQLAISPKNLRLSATLISIYQLLIAHVLLFIVLLGLAHAEKMRTMLALDIEDQKEYGLYDLTPFSNQIRLKTASELISITEFGLYVATCIASVYLLSCLSLFIGVFKSRPQFILLWSIVDGFFIIILAGIMFWARNEKIVESLFKCKILYYATCLTYIAFESMNWINIRIFYREIRQIRKLTEIATVAIPCPQPGTIPFHFRRENMHLGSNGYKHVLSDVPDDNIY